MALQTKVQSGYYAPIAKVAPAREVRRGVKRVEGFE